jgi:hypothetical protein
MGPYIDMLLANVTALLDPVLAAAKILLNGILLTYSSPDTYILLLNVETPETARLFENVDVPRTLKLLLTTALP